MEMLMLAEWWHESPDAVYSWPMPTYLTRQEYMFVKMEIENKPSKDKDNGLKPGEKEWLGRPKQ